MWCVSESTSHKLPPCNPLQHASAFKKVAHALHGPVNRPGITTEECLQFTMGSDMG